MWWVHWWGARLSGSINLHDLLVGEDRDVAFSEVEIPLEGVRAGAGRPRRAKSLCGGGPREL